MCRVHVFAVPDDGTGLGPDETTCEEITLAHDVVYHLHTTQLTRGGWVCIDCGLSDRGSDAAVMQ